MSKLPQTPAPAKPAATKPRRAAKPKNAFALPVRPASAAPIPDFAPVPRVYNRHDGWTPERQRAFIGALADTGCVSRAARMVNMAQANCYTLRRAKGAEGFRAAWDAALDCGLAQMKDIAFERAIEGELVPVFANGKHMGFRRKRNDALLMFVLRHYGKDASGKRTTINYFSSRASAGAASNGSNSSAGAEASHTTVTTVITGGGASEDRSANEDKAAALVEGFEGIALDTQARAEIMAALEACAAREQALDAAYAKSPGQGFELAAQENTAEAYLPLPHGANPYQGAFEPDTQWEEVNLPAGEDTWASLGKTGTEWVAVPAEGKDSSAKG